MSGPKGIRYRVQREAEARRRREVACRGRIARLRRELVLLQDLYRDEDTEAGLAGSGSQVVADMRESELDQLEEGLTRTLARARRTIEDARQETAQKSLERELESVARALESASIELEIGETTAPDGSYSSSAQESRIARSAASLAPLLAELRSEEQRQEFAARAARLARALSERAPAIARRELTVLTSELNEAISKQRYELTLRESAEAVVTSLSHVDPHHRERAEDMVDRIRSRSDLAALHEEGARVLAAHEAEQDRAYVVQHTRMALADMGYEVAEEFDALSLSGEAAIVRKPDLPDHGLRVQFPAGSSQMLTRVVAFDETSPERDREVERQTCRHIGQMHEVLEKAGIDVALEHSTPIGDLPVQRVDPPARRNSVRAKEGEL